MTARSLRLHQNPTNLPRILAIVGPTASGKTQLALSLAQTLDCEIVSADSRQVYKYLTIGTAKPTRKERSIVPHHLIDVLEPDSEYSAGQYAVDAKAVITGILKRKKLPLLVGGSGLYIKALVDGLFDGPGKDIEIRKWLEEQVESEGIQSLLALLKKVDPVTLQGMKEVSARRVVRALEVFYITGKPMSAIRKEKAVPSFCEAAQFGIAWERSELYGRINARAEVMFAEGLVEEVAMLKKKGYDRRFNALNTVGYKEVFDMLDGLQSQDRTLELVKQNTRRFAKRQMTWFSADRRIEWMHATERNWVDRMTQRIVTTIGREAE